MYKKKMNSLNWHGKKKFKNKHQLALMFHVLFLAKQHDTWDNNHLCFHIDPQHIKCSNHLCFHAYSSTTYRQLYFMNINTLLVFNYIPTMRFCSLYPSRCPAGLAPPLAELLPFLHNSDCCDTWLSVWLCLWLVLLFRVTLDYKCHWHCYHDWNITIQRF